jgi:hypothetical protein
MGVSKMSLPRVRQARNEAIPEVIADPSSLIPFAIVGPHSEGPYSRRRQVPLRISRMTQETETAIREFCQQYSGPDTIINQVRNNLAILSTLIKAARPAGPAPAIPTRALMKQFISTLRFGKQRGRPTTRRGGPIFLVAAKYEVIGMTTF